MSLISLPSVTVNVLPGTPAVDNAEHSVLIIGQKTAAGSATSGTIKKDVQLSDLTAFFGVNSHVAGLVRNFRKINASTKVDVLPYSDNGAGVAAAATITVTGPATASGTLLVSVGSSLDHSVSVTVSSGDTANTIAAAIVTALGTLTTLPVTAGAVTNVVTLTHVHKGTIGNNLTLKVSGLPAGVSVALSAFAGGLTDPVIDLPAVLSNIRYNSIVFPGTWSASAMDTFLESRLNVTNDILDGVAIMTKVDTYANLATLATSLNQPLMAIFGDLKQTDTAAHVGGLLEEMADAVSAQIAAVRALRLTTGTNTSQIVLSSVGSNDLTGGIHMASLPYFNTPMSYLPVQADGKGFTRIQIDALKAVGISVIGNNIARNGVVLGEVVTTYTTDGAGNPDTTFKFLESIDTSLAVREYFRNNIRARFGQHRLTSGTVDPRHAMANPEMIKSFLVSVYETLSNTGFVLVQGGRSATKFFKDNLNVAINMSTGTASIDMRLPIVTQLRSFVVQARFTQTAL